MKKLAALATVVISTGIQAAPDRDIYDLMYLPKAGTIYGTTSLGFGQQKLEAKDSSADEEVEGFEINQVLGYALTDRFSLDIALDYTDVEGDPEVGEKYDAAKGLSDPTITARFRTMDEVFRWDLVGGALINFVDREIDDGDRNNVQGGHSFFIGTEFGTKTDNVQWLLGGYLIHNLEAETEVKTSLGDANIEEDSNNELLLRAALHHRLIDKNFLQWSASGRFTEEVGNDREQFVGKTAPQSNYQFGLEYQYAASEDLLVRLGGNYQIFNTQTGQIDDFTGWNGYIGASYQF